MLRLARMLLHNGAGILVLAYPCRLSRCQKLYEENRSGFHGSELTSDSWGTETRPVISDASHPGVGGPACPADVGGINASVRRGHITRKFDSEGRVLAEEQVADSPQLNQLPEELRSRLNPEQMKSVGAMIAGTQNRTYSYTYDEHGRVTERRRSGGMTGEQVAITKYNDYGNKASERTTTVMNRDTGPWSVTETGAFIPAGKQNPPQPPSSSETRYTHQYDQYGNWTGQTIEGRSQPDEEFRPGTVIRRKLTYY